MMPLCILKELSIGLGLYRPTRWLSRRVRPNRWDTFQDDIAFYKQLIPNRELCFDVGANIGEKSEALLNAGLRVAAFEPNPDVIPELKARCQHDPNWTLLQAGLGSKSDIATLHIKASHLASSMKEEWEGQRNIACVPVPVVTLDSAIDFSDFLFSAKSTWKDGSLRCCKG
jgi:FkbM family methyltransferase